MESQGNYRDGMPYVGVSIAGSKFEALMDTGFDGYLLLPKLRIEQLGLKRVGASRFRTADGRVNEADVYAASIDWLGSRVRAKVDCTDGDIALVGMRLLGPLKIVMEPDRRILTLATRA